MSDTLNESILEQIATWLSERSRPGGHFDCPTTGFGFPKRFAKVGIKDGLTLHLPSPAVKPVTRFKNGRPITTVAESCLEDPEIRRMRDRVLRTVTSAGIGLLRVPDEFIEYAAAVVGINYAFDDADLDDIFSTTTWHSPMIRHLVGGDDVIAAAAQLMPRVRPETVATSPDPLATLAPAVITDPTISPAPAKSKRGRGRPRKNGGAI